MKEIKDYIHLYYGGNCVIVLNDGSGYSAPLKITSDVLRNNELPDNHEDKIKWKILCRPLSDIKEEEDAESDVIYYSIADKHSQQFELVTQADAAVTHYLLSKHFDLFNLHEAGLCLYRNEKGELY